MDAREVPRWIARWDAAALTVERDLPCLPAPIERSELVWSVPLDADDQARGCVRVAQGSENRVHLALPAFLAVPLAAQSERVALVHSHPSGSLAVSEEDKQLTRSVLIAATACGLTLVDHVVVTPNGGTFSFVEGGILEAAPSIAEVIAAQE